MTEKWVVKAAVGRAATAKGVDKLVCSYKTMSWMIGNGASIDIAILGDVPGGEEFIGSWRGKRIMRGDGDDVLTIHRHDGSVSHVRVRDGAVHDGKPGDCYEGECLAETVMGS